MWEYNTSIRDTLTNVRYMESFVKGTGICPRPNNLSLSYVIYAMVISFATVENSFSMTYT
jgi:hypothetical protein